MSLGKNFHHVYNLAMSEPVTQTHEYREAFQYLKMSERIGLIETLTTFSQSLRKNGKLQCTQSYKYYKHKIPLQSLGVSTFSTFWWYVWLYDFILKFSWLIFEWETKFSLGILWPKPISSRTRYSGHIRGHP